MLGLDESRVISVKQQDGDGVLTLHFQFQLQGMGKPDKFNVTTLAVESVESTIEEMKIKLCKVAKKLEKRSRRKERKADNAEASTAGSACAEKDTSQEKRDEEKPGLLSSITAKWYHTALYQTFTIWRAHETETETKKIPNNENEVNERTLRMIQIDILDKDGCRVDGQEDTVNGFINGRTVVIRICNQAYTYQIHRNLPAVRILELPKHASSGFILYPRVEADFCDMNDCHYDWFTITTRPGKYNRLSIQNGQVYSGNAPVHFDTKVEQTLENGETKREQASSHLVSDDTNASLRDLESTQIDTKDSEATVNGNNSVATVNGNNSVATVNGNNSVATVNGNNSVATVNGNNSVATVNGNKGKVVQHWKWVHRGIEFIPGTTDVDVYVGVVCTPISGDRIGCSVVAETKNPIWRRQEVYPFEKRHAHTMTSSVETGFRVVTYNVLAEKYSDTCESRDFRYSYCPPFALTHDYRKQLIFGELFGYQAEVMCLQEVDCKAFHNDFLPVLGRRGYAGSMATKHVLLSQGVATFYHEDQFSLIHKDNINTAKVLESHIENAELLKKLGENPVFLEKVKHTGAVLLSMVLEHKRTGRRILVANTHLKSGKEFAHIRMVQTVVCLNHIGSLLQTYKDAAVIMCGDLNSMEYSGVVELLRTGGVAHNHADWFIGGRFDFISGMNVQHSLPLTFKSAYYGLPYTNYVAGFFGTLDYIHYDGGKLECTSTVPLPTHDEVVELSALPNPRFPSDHMALVCDLTFK